MSDQEWAFSTARGLSKALRARKVSSLELTQDAIARIERLDSRINAICVRDFSRAIEAARAADDALAKGDIGALTGVPMTVRPSTPTGMTIGGVTIPGTTVNQVVGSGLNLLTSWLSPVALPAATQTAIATPTDTSALQSQIDSGFLGYGRFGLLIGASMPRRRY